MCSIVRVNDYTLVVVMPWSSHPKLSHRVRGWLLIVCVVRLALISESTLSSLVPDLLKGRVLIFSDPVQDQRLVRVAND